EATDHTSVFLREVSKRLYPAEVPLQAPVRVEQLVVTAPARHGAPVRVLGEDQHVRAGQTIASPPVEVDREPIRATSFRFNSDTLHAYPFFSALPSLPRDGRFRLWRTYRASFAFRTIPASRMRRTTALTDSPVAAA